MNTQDVRMILIGVHSILKTHNEIMTQLVDEVERLKKRIDDLTQE